MPGTFFPRDLDNDPGLWTFGLDQARQSVFYRRVRDELDASAASAYFRSLGMKPYHVKRPICERVLLAGFYNKNWTCMGRHLDGELTG